MKKYVVLFISLLMLMSGCGKKNMANIKDEFIKNVEKKSSYFHYKGNYSGSELINEMTKYDIGLAIYNLSNNLASYMDIASPNKITEYLSAGLPVVSNVSLFIEMLEKYDCGGRLDLERDVKKQLLSYKSIKIENDFLQKHGLTMDANADRIIDFYKKITESWKHFLFQKYKGAEYIEVL